MRKPFFFTADDALFYHQVATNIASQHWSTFNGLISTNGYHPLWMLCSVAVAAISSGDRMDALRLALCLQFVFLLCLLYLYRRLADTLGGSLVGQGLVVLLFSTSFWGLESHLSALCAFGAALGFQRSVRGSLSAATAGALVGLAVLARLDNIFLLVIMLGLVACWPGEPWRRKLTWMGLFGLAAAVVVTPYVAANQFWIGHPFPISGAIKSTLPHINLNLHNLSPMQWLVLVGGVGGIAVATSGLVGDIRIALLVLSGQTVLQGLYTLVLTTQGANAWYAAVGCVNLALVADVVAAHLQARMALFGPRHVVFVARGTAVIAVTAMLVAVGRSVLKADGLTFNPIARTALANVASKTGRRWQEEFADWMNRKLPRNSRIAVMDFPGFMAFCTPFPILPLDGLMGDYSYNEDIVRSGISAYLKDKRITHFLGPVPGDGEAVGNGWMRATRRGNAVTVSVVAPLSRKDAGAFVVQVSDLMTDVVQLTGKTWGHGVVGLYRLPWAEQ